MSCIIETDTFVRANSTTVGGTSGGQSAWVDPYASGQIVSNQLTGRHTTANTAATTLAGGGSTAGTAVVTFTLATGYVAGDLVSLETGTSNVEYMQILSVASNVVTFTAATANNHAAGVAITKIRDQPIVRPIGEAKQDCAMLIKFPALTSTAFRSAMYLRWINAGTFVSIVVNWNGSTQFQTQVYYATNGTITNLSSTNWTSAVAAVVWLQCSVSGINPTTVTVKPYVTSNGLTKALSGGTGTGVYTGTITNGNNSAIQTAGQQGYGFADLLSALTFSETYDKTSTTIPVSNSNFVAGLAPYVWNAAASPTNVETNNVGAYWKGSISGLDGSIPINSAQWQASSGSTYVIYTIDEGAWVSLTLAPGATSIPLFSDLLYGTHTVRLYWLANLGGGTPNLWTGTPSSTMQFLGVNMDTGETLAAPTVATDYMAFYTDSLGLNPSDAENSSSGIPSPHLNHIATLAQGLGCEYGNIAFGGQALSVNFASYNVPPIFTPSNDTASSYNKFWAGASRFVAGLYAPPPKYVVLQFGTNDALHGGTSGGVTTNLTALMVAIRAAAPNTIILVLEPFGLFMAAALQAGVAAANDPKAFYVAMPTWTSAGLTAGGIPTWASGDGIHQNLGSGTFLSAVCLANVMLTLNPSKGNASIGNGHFMR